MIRAHVSPSLRQRSRDGSHSRMRLPRNERRNCSGKRGEEGSLANCETQSFSRFITFHGCTQPFNDAFMPARRRRRKRKRTESEKERERKEGGHSLPRADKDRTRRGTKRGGSAFADFPRENHAVESTSDLHVRRISAPRNCALVANRRTRN